MNIKPIGDRILVEPLEEKERVKGGIIIPDAAKEKPLEAKVIADLAYWAENAAPGRDCDGTRVAQLLAAGARFLEPAATTQTTLDVLLKWKIITARDYWAKTAVPSGLCAGKNVATVIRNLAERVPSTPR